jgi:hypothetical protein
MKKLKWLLTVALILFSSVLAQALTVGWDDNDNPPGTVTAYGLYISATSMGSATVILITPPTLREYTFSDSLLIPGPPGTKSYMRLTARGAGGESDPSNEVIWTRPTTSSTSTSIIPTTTTTSSIPRPFSPKSMRIKIVTTTTIP